MLRLSHILYHQIFKIILETNLLLPYFINKETKSIEKLSKSTIYHGGAEVQTWTEADAQGKRSKVKTLGVSRGWTYSSEFTLTVLQINILCVWQTRLLISLSPKMKKRMFSIDFTHIFSLVIFIFIF